MYDQYSEANEKCQASAEREKDSLGEISLRPEENWRIPPILHDSDKNTKVTNNNRLCTGISILAPFGSDAAACHILPAQNGFGPSKTFSFL